MAEANAPPPPPNLRNAGQPDREPVVAPPPLPAAEPIPYWKCIGIYQSPTSGRSAYIVGTGSAADPLEALLNDTPIDYAPSADGLSITIDGDIFNKVVTDDAQFVAAKKKKATIGTSGRTVYVGTTCVFKNSFLASFSLESVVQEASRNLRCISKGIPHAYCYGIYEENEGGAGGGAPKYYFMEELLDIPRSHELYVACFDFLYNMPLRHTVFKGALLQDAQQGERANFVEAISRPYSLFISEFTTLVKLLQEKNIGGDFKLDNVAFVRGENKLVFTDLAFPSDGNSSLPKSWVDWLAIAKTEEPDTEVFTNSLRRLQYWLSTTGTATLGGKSSLLEKKSTESTASGKPIALLCNWDAFAPKGSGGAGKGGGKRKTKKVKKNKKN
jgi:hypothetical protein